MRALGTLGRPEEYLRLDLDDEYRERWGLSSDASGDELIAAMTAHGRTRNGVFGIKLHWFQFELLLRRLRALELPEEEPYGGDDAALLGRYFGSVRWVHLERSDTLRQAVSWYRAIHTDEWWRLVGEPDPGASVEYDFEAIKHLYYLLLDYRRAWRRWFEAHGDQVLGIGYEELSADLDGCLLRIVEHVGVRPPVRLPSPSLARQSDEVTERLVASYERSSAALFGTGNGVRPASLRGRRGAAPAR
jgi:LPS sulfotransferase NodH